MPHSLARYIPDRLGNELRGLFVLVTDVSTIKAVEERLRESEERHQAVLDAQIDAILRLGRLFCMPTRGTEGSARA